MKTLSVLLFILFTASSTYAQQPITGVWNTGNENTKIVIKQVNGKMVGSVLSSDNRKSKKGTMVLKGGQLRKGVWKGKLYVVRKGEWVDATFVRTGNKLKITVDVGRATRTIEWKKGI